MLQETDEFGILFSEWVSFAGCSAWTLVWMLMHRVLPPKLDCERTDCPTKSMHTFYVRKLNRMLSTAWLPQPPACRFLELFLPAATD